MKRTKFDLLVYWLFFLFKVMSLPILLLYHPLEGKLPRIPFVPITILMILIWLIFYKILKRFKHADIVYGFFGFSVMGTLIFLPLFILTLITKPGLTPPVSFIILAVIIWPVIANFSAGFWSGWRLGKRGVPLSIAFFFVSKMLNYLMLPRQLGIKTALIHINTFTILTLVFVVCGSLVASRLSKGMEKEEAAYDKSESGQKNLGAQS